jgi:hypothetical protein
MGSGTARRPMPNEVVPERVPDRIRTERAASGSGMRAGRRFAGDTIRPGSGLLLTPRSPWPAGSRGGAARTNRKEGRNERGGKTALIGCTQWRDRVRGNRSAPLGVRRESGRIQSGAGSAATTEGIKESQWARERNGRSLRRFCGDRVDRMHHLLPRTASSANSGGVVGPIASAAAPAQPGGFRPPMGRYASPGDALHRHFITRSTE